MKFYVLIFEYAGGVHMDVVKENPAEHKTTEDFRTWLAEATRFAVDDLGLKDRKFPTVKESAAFELCLVNGDVPYVELPNKPKDSISEIHLKFD